MKTKYLLSAVLLAAQLFCGSAFAAPAVSATASNALEVEPQGEVFLSPDFIWSEETPGEFQVRFTITNGSDTVIPETEVRITLPDAALQFDAEASFSGQKKAGGLCPRSFRGSFTLRWRSVFPPVPDGTCKSASAVRRRRLMFPRS